MIRVWQEPTANDLTETFAYNPSSQMVSRTVSNDAYLYLGNENITGQYSVNGLNQYTGAGGKSFTYDANGNMTSDGYSTYVYDIENRLISVSGAKNLTLQYDPKGRLYRTSGSTITDFLYDGDALVAEYSSSGTLLKRYMHGPGADAPLIWYEGATVSSTNRRYLYADRQGSIIGVTNSAGSSLARNTYDAFGIPGTTNLGRFSYTGQTIIPEIDLLYYKARIYNPQFGRFMQTDPVGYEDQMNMYAYVGNDPFNASDPTGRTQDAYSMYRNNQAMREIRRTNPEFAAKADKVVLYVAAALLVAAVGTISPAISIGISIGEMSDGEIGPAALPLKSTVGRVMSPVELKAMQKTGRVQESYTGTTHVTNPANPSSYKAGGKDSVYVEFDVPTSSLKPTSNKGVSKVLGPKTLEGRAAKATGKPVPQMPYATRIVQKHKK